MVKQHKYAMHFALLAYLLPCMVWAEIGKVPALYKPLNSSSASSSPASSSPAQL